MVQVTQVDNIRNSSWSYSGWGWNYWSGYQDSFINVNLKQGTVAKSISVGFKIEGINIYDLSEIINVANGIKIHENLFLQKTKFIKLTDLYG